MKIRSTSTFVVASLLATTLAGCNDEKVLNDAAGLGKATISAAAIDFGSAPCGGDAPEAKTFTIKNTGEGPLRWSAALPADAIFSIQGSDNGVVDAGSTATITVAASSMPSATDAGAVVTATMTITTDDPIQGAVYVPVTAVATGATFELIAPTDIDFGTVPVGATSPEIGVVFRNVGNASAKVAIEAPSDAQYAFAWDGGADPVEVAAGADMPGLVATFSPTLANGSASAGVVKVEGAVCGASASAIPAHGAGLGGQVGLSPGTIDYGKVGCNTQPPEQSLVLFNAGNLGYSWEAKLKDGTRYTLSKTVGAIKAGGIVEIIVESAPMEMTTKLGDNEFGDTVVVTTSVPGDMPHEIPIKQSAKGAILKLSGGPLEFGEVPMFTEAQPKKVTVTNEGNNAATVTIGGAAEFSGMGGKVNGNGGTLMVDVVYTANTLGASKGLIQLETNDPICAPLPKGLLGTGKGKGIAESLSVGGWTRNIGDHMNGGCILLKNSGGRVACFGNNDFGQLGNPTGQRGIAVIPELKDVVQIASNGQTNCAVDKVGDVWCWGWNNKRNGNRINLLGDQNLERSHVPVKHPDIANAKKVALGHNMACALLLDGNVTCWGSNRRGNLGRGGSSGNSNAPDLINGLNDIKDIALGGGGGCAVDGGGNAFCWGRMAHGNLGNGNCCDGEPYGPNQVIPYDAFSALSASTARSRSGSRCALGSNGNVFCWGDGRRFQFGDGSNDRNNPYPHGVPLPNQATAIAGKMGGHCALLVDKTIVCWGHNDYGSTGDGSFGYGTPYPSYVQGISDATFLAAGGLGACAIVGGGSVQCWGRMGAGQSNNATPKTLPGF